MGMWLRNELDKPIASCITREKENFQILLGSRQKDSEASLKRAQRWDNLSSNMMIITMD